VRFARGGYANIRPNPFLGNKGPVMKLLLVSPSGPEQMDFRKSSTLGLTLINSLVGQLGGTIDLDRTKGTAFTIKFG